MNGFWTAFSLLGVAMLIGLAARLIRALRVIPNF